MKNKSARHKEENTFKFKPFSERLSSIDIDIFHRVGHAYETEEEQNISHFYQDFEKWLVLNLTGGYANFKKELRSCLFYTLPQVVLHKDQIVEILLRYLKLKDPLYLQPLLSLTASLAKDLRKEFYEYYPRFYDILFELLETKDTEQLEWVFTCLAHFFKFLWRFLIKDIAKVFSSLLPLLSESQPEYINNFAAESFAFVARKVRNRKSFLDLILRKIQNEHEGISGCGKLLFEVIKGVEGQFHSCAEEVLPFLLESLADSEFPQSTLLEVLECTVAHTVNYINPQKAELLWKSILTNLRGAIEDWKFKKSSQSATTLKSLLVLLGEAVEYKDGKVVLNPKDIINEIVNVLSLHELPGDICLISVKITIVTLLSRHIKLPQESAAFLIENTLAVEDKEAKLFFVNNVTEYSSFGALIVPSFLKSCVVNNLERDYFRILTNVLLKKSPICGNGENLGKWKIFPLNLQASDNNEIIENIVYSIISEEKMPDSSDDSMEKLFCSLVCIPHFNFRNKDKFKETLCQRTSHLIGDIGSENSKSKLFLLNLFIECIVHLKHFQYFEDHFLTILDAVLASIKDENILYVLNILSLVIVAVQDKEWISIDILRKMNQYLEPYFSSPYHEVRSLLTFIYSVFEDIPHFDLKHSDDPEIKKEKFNIFSICHTIESIDSQIHTYRDQVQCLEKMSYEKPQFIMCKQTEFKSIPLRYMCGVLYMNFQLLWEPTLKIIESHAHGLDITTFWGVYGEQLRRADNFISNGGEVITEKIDCDYETLQGFFEKWQAFQSKPDFVNHRLLLWRGLGLFPDVAEMKTRDTSELLLSFYEKEFVKCSSELALTWNIKQNSSEVIEDLVEDKLEGQDSETDKIKPKFTKMSGKVKLKTFVQYLKIFSQIRSPKSMYRESELKKLYYTLLQHKNAEIQKAALDCLLTYKEKYMVVYKENLYNLIDDKNFKNELATFDVDREGSTVLEECREDLISVVLRIVYSKMNAKIGQRTGGKSNGQHRRSLIVKFLGGCYEKEKVMFIRMIFKYYDRYLGQDRAKLAENVDLEKFIPPKKLQSSINMLGVILEHFGDSLAKELLTELMNYILIIGAFIKGAFRRISEVHAGYFTPLKNLRSSCIKLVSTFFEKFESYEWKREQINDIFDLFVWPYLAKLSGEGIHSPTALLKLFVVWGSNPRFFPLLVKHKDGDEKQFVLPNIMELLLNKNCHHTVTSVILGIIEKLLILKSDDNNETLGIPIDDVLPINQETLDRVKVYDLNYGSCILLPHVFSVVSRMQRSLERKSKSLNRQELFILSRISELIWQNDISEKTLNLLLPIVLKKCTGNSDEEIVNQFLTSVKNLLHNVDKPSEFFKQISPLFGEISHASGRKILTSIIDLVVKKCDDQQIVLMKSVCDELNAFDSKWIDQPDFQRRHDAFKLIHNLIKEDKIELQLGVLLIFNSYHFLSSDKDLSFKENSSHLLQTLCPYLLKKYESSKQENDYLLEIMLCLIRKGMKSKNDDLRNECILLLGNLARKCPQNSFILRDLNIFTNEKDLEVDFFENLVHLQIHRQARAMTKFCQILKEQTVMSNPQTLTRFLLPLVSHYLLNEKYSNKNSVIDASIESVGMISRILPWHQYDSLLRFYLGKLTDGLSHQKQLVRLTVAVLDSFHFDLRKAGNGNVQDVDVEKQKASLQGDNVPKEGEEKDIVDVDDNMEAVQEENTEEDLVEALEKQEESEDVHEELEESEEKICEKISILCPSTATRVIFTIQKILLPKLNKALAQMTHRDSSHKLNKKITRYEQEEDDLLKIPISLAVVKLLQRMPKEVLDTNLPGVFMKTCTFLKSHLESVRRVARETLQQMMLTLGPSYLKLLLSEMSPLLRRGFQAHVLVFTVHGILNCLRSQYQPGDIDKILHIVLKLCNLDLFGVLSEEKEISKIRVKTSEAKSSKSLDIYQLLAQFITESCILELLLPFKSLLETSVSFKTIYKIQECLRCIALGLVDNKFLATEGLLKFAHGIASEKIPKLLTGKTQQKLTEKQKELLQRQKPDCYIIPKAPVGKSGIRINTVKKSDKANSHILIEFGLRICFLLLKRDRLADEHLIPQVDPFVELFTQCLHSKHVKLCTVTLQCLSWIFKYNIPSLKVHIKEITSDIFSILHKYAAAGLSKGDNFDLVVAAFKAMSVLLKEVKFHVIETDQLKALLLYVEQDMHDPDRQAVAFNLMKAILRRKLIVPEVHDIMKKIEELSILSESDHVRTQARSVTHQFLMNYPLGKKMESHVVFYLSQASFEMQYGRESALEMIGTLINSFTLKILSMHSGTILITLGARLVNEETPELRKKVASCLTNMIEKLPHADREPLFDIILLWFSDKNLNHRRLAAQVCGIFVNVEKAAFENRLPVLIPIIMKQFGLHDFPGKFVKLDKEEDTDSEEKKKVSDHHHFQVLQLLLKLCARCPGFLNDRDAIKKLAIHCQNFLKHPHDWVRLAACQFLGFVISSIDIDHLSELLMKNEEDDSGYLMSDPYNSLKSLTLDLCDQLQPENLRDELAEQVVKNLIFVVRVIQKLPISGDDSKKINLLWLCKRLRKIVNLEIVENPSSIVIRTVVFKWIGGVAMALESETLLPILHHLMAPLVREMLTTEASNAPLRQLSKEVGNIIKKKIGLELFTETLSKLQQHLAIKRTERKRFRNQLAVVDPELHAKKKIRKNEKKREGKKRKIADHKGVKRPFKKRRVADLEDASDII